MARRAYLIDSLRAETKALLVDAGDYTHRQLTREDRYNWFVLDAMGRMGYQAITLGELELYRGVEYVERILAESKIPVTLANVKFTSSGKRVGEEFVVSEVDGVRYGVIGLLAQDFGDGIEKFEELGFTVEEPFDVATRLVPRVRKQADMVVILAHMGSTECFQLPKNVPGIDVVVFGHNQGSGAAATQVEGAVTVRAGYRGQTLGETRLVVNPEHQIVSYSGQAVALGLKEIPEDVAIADDLAALKEEIEAEVERAQLEQELRNAETRLVMGQDQYLGDLKCARCHFDVFKQWQETGHAQAWEALVSEQRDGDAQCIQCHTTGYQQPGGFRGIGAEQDMRNVQCESCHGMGTLHDMAAVTTVLDEQSCLPCHDAANSPAFDFESYWERIAH